MPKLVGFGKYSPQGAAGVIEQGFTARKEVLAVSAAELGGTQDGYWVVADARWDFMFLWNLPEQALPKVQNLFLQAGATGAFSDSDSHWLLEPEVVDAARSGPVAYRPPNA